MRRKMRCDFKGEDDTRLRRGEGLDRVEDDEREERERGRSFLEGLKR